MSRLTPSTTISGSGGVSSLIRSASSLQNTIANYEDSIQAFQYENSGHTDTAYAAYKDYLSSRINTLNSTGTISDAQKALTLTKSLESATHANVSANIQRENIQIMAGNATLQDKYNLIVKQYTEAVNNGDLTLAQTLESQAYSVNQSIQYQAQQAADAAAALAKAGNGTTTGTSGVTYQGDVVTNLKEALKNLTTLGKNASETQLNQTLKDYVQGKLPGAEQAPKQLAALGVNIKTDQPNYWDVVNGIAGAIYNASVLKAQAEAPINPLVSETYAQQAQDYLTGAAKFDTLGGSLTMQDLQQAMKDPAMFAYDNTKGTYIRSTVSGYQYMTDQNGKQFLAPTYSGIAPKTQQGGDNVLFLSPNQTTAMTKLGLNFSENKSGTTGNGVQVQLTENSPQWLKSILGENGVSNFYTDNNGNLVFKAASLDGKGDSSGNAYYTLSTDASGLHGIFEHTLNGQISLAGGDYGFNAGAAQLLINQAQGISHEINVQQQLQAAQLALAKPKPLPAISVPRPVAPAQHIVQPPRISAPQPVAPHVVNPQTPGVNPQQTSGNVQGAAGFQGGNNFNLLTSGGGGIRL